MNKISLSFCLLCLLVAALFSGCGEDPVAVECTDGSGTVATEQRTPGLFSGIILSDNINVVLAQGEHNVRVEADDNFLSLITTELRGTMLYIGVNDNTCLRNGSATVYVTGPQLQRISTEGSGSITGRAAFSPESFTVVSIGSGDVQVTGATTRALSASIGGSGSIQIKGRATTLTAQLNGSGSLRAFETPVEEALIKLTGSGSAEVNVSRRLDVTLSGSGDVIYTGSPTIFSVITGSGTVKRKP